MYFNVTYHVHRTCLSAHEGDIRIFQPPRHVWYFLFPFQLPAKRPRLVSWTLAANNSWHRPAIQTSVIRIFRARVSLRIKSRSQRNASEATSINPLLIHVRVCLRKKSSSGRFSRRGIPFRRHGSSTRLRNVCFGVRMWGLGLLIPTRGFVLFFVKYEMLLLLLCAHFLSTWWAYWGERPPKVMGRGKWKMKHPSDLAWYGFEFSW